MPLIESLSFTDQNIAAGKSVMFAAAPANYEGVNLRVFLYDLAALSTAKTFTTFITKAGSGVESRLNITPSLASGFASIVLSSDPFSISIGDVVRIQIVGSASDTANVDIIAELWGIPDLSALITTVDTVVDALAVALADVPTAAEIDAELSGTHGAGTWGNGSGSISTTVTVNDGVNPIDGVDVWVSTDSAGTNVIARGSTGALGTVVFWLDAGTYYAWKQLAGYDFTNPQSFTVS